MKPGRGRQEGDPRVWRPMDRDRHQLDFPGISGYFSSDWRRKHEVLFAVP